MELREEWEKLLEVSEMFYIYGAGEFGRKIFNLIKLYGKQKKVKGFLVTNKISNPRCIDGISVFQIDEISDRNSVVLLAVADIYQEEISDLLEMKQFNNVILAYKFYVLEEEISTEDRVSPVVMMDTKELCKRILEEPKVDIIVRILAIEEYYGFNSYGFELYKKMQDLRIRKGYSLYAERRFKALIQSIEESIKEKGYFDASEIFINKQSLLIDGAHRIALATYHKQPYVKVRIIDREKRAPSFGMDWFLPRFSHAEIDIIRNKLLEVSQQWL